MTRSLGERVDYVVATLRRMEVGLELDLEARTICGRPFPAGSPEEAHLRYTLGTVRSLRHVLLGTGGENTVDSLQESAILQP